MARTMPVAQAPTKNRPRSGRGRLLLALALAGLSAFLAFTYLQQAGRAVPETGSVPSAPATTPVLVAAVGIPAGTRITAEMVAVKQVPVGAGLPSGFESPDPVLGSIARYPIAAGEQVLPGKVVADAPPPALSYVVPEGHRAMAISVSAVVSAGGLILPGDRVDVLAVVEAGPRSGEGDTSGAGPQAVLVAADVEVLAVAQSLVRVAPADGEDRSGAAPEGTAEPNALTATLGLTPDEAQRVFLAESQGPIRLMVRRPGDGTTLNLSPLSNLARTR
jgi:pilus assembly protein CpaB